MIEPESSHSVAMAEIVELADNLSNLLGVKKVVVVTRIPNDLHHINFYLDIADNNENDYIWELGEKMAMRCHRRLRKETGKRWYFHAELLDNSELRYIDDDCILATVFPEISTNS